MYSDGLYDSQENDTVQCIGMIGSQQLIYSENLPVHAKSCEDVHTKTVNSPAITLHCFV